MPTAPPRPTSSPARTSAPNTGVAPGGASRPASPRPPASPAARPPARPAASALHDAVDVETPELVAVSYEVAGLGTRAAAAFVDALLAVVVLVAAGFVAAAVDRALPLARSAAGPWLVAAVVLFEFAVGFGWFVLWEGLGDGRTPGKRLFGLRVVQEGGFPVTLPVAAVRNLLRLVDLQPAGLHVVGLIAVTLSRRGQRLGDLAAGTLVVHERVARRARADAAAAERLQRAAAGGHEASEAAAPRTTLLDDARWAVLDRWAVRRATLDAATAATLAAALAERLAPALDALARETGTAPDDATAALARLQARERAAREGGAVVRGARGAARERWALVHDGRARWDAYQARLDAARRRGLAALDEEAVSGFAADYRETAADLARLRAASGGALTDDVLRLGRLVAEGHHLLYRRDRAVGRELARYVAHTIPRAVRDAWRPVLLGALLLFGPMATSAVAVARTPALAPRVVPRAMLDRADAGVERARRGTGYIEDPKAWRPVMASGIAVNNLLVTYAAFAGGLTAGVGTVFALVNNGVSIGAVFGLYHAKGIFPLLLAFIAPHGVLELTAICIAGGAGLLLAAALLLPGARTRREALVANGRRAAHLLAASTLLLLVAGAIEGLISPIPTWPLGGKLAVAGVTGVVLAVWLVVGGGTTVGRATTRGE